MTNTIQQKLEDILGTLPPNALDEIYNELYDVLCKTLIGLLQDSKEGLEISEEQIESAREFAMIAPDNDAAKELLEFLDSDEIKEAVIEKETEQ